MHSPLALLTLMMSRRTQVYRGVQALSRRDFKLAATLFLETVSTFTSYELMSYKDFVTLTVLLSVIALNRATLKEKVRPPRPAFLLRPTALSPPFTPVQLVPASYG